MKLWISHHVRTKLYVGSMQTDVAKQIGFGWVGGRGAYVADGRILQQPGVRRGVALVRCDDVGPVPLAHLRQEGADNTPSSEAER